jgi:hypothetical protein
VRDIRIGIVVMMSVCACGTTLDLGERPSTLDGGALSDGASASPSDGALGDGSSASSDDAAATDGGKTGSDGASASDASQTGCGGETCYVFVTSAKFTPDFGGIAAGDAKCQSAAMTAGLSRASHYKVYLSDGSAAAWSRITSNGPWLLTGTNQLLFATAQDLRVNGGTTIDRDESGQQQLGAHYWTGAGAQGNPGDTCVGFTSVDPMQQGAVGAWPHWIDSYSEACASLPLPLLCFED